MVEESRGVGSEAFLYENGTVLTALIEGHTALIGPDDTGGLVEGYGSVTGNIHIASAVGVRITGMMQGRINEVNTCLLTVPEAVVILNVRVLNNYGVIERSSPTGEEVNLSRISASYLIGLADDIGIKNVKGLFCGRAILES